MAALVPIVGGAYKVTPTVTAATLASLVRTQRYNCRSREVTVYAPDGNDGPSGPAANTDVVFAGPAGSAAFPIGPGASKTWWNVNPWDLGISSPASGQLLFVTFSGSDGPNE